MEYENCELTEDDQPASSDKEVSPEEEGDVSEYSSTDDKPVERISYTKVVHCVMESTVYYHCS